MNLSRVTNSVKTRFNTINIFSYKSTFLLFEFYQSFTNKFSWIQKLSNVEAVDGRTYKYLEIVSTIESNSVDCDVDWLNNFKYSWLSVWQTLKLKAFIGLTLIFVYGVFLVMMTMVMIQISSALWPRKSSRRRRKDDNHFHFDRRSNNLLMMLMMFTYYGLG